MITQKKVQELQPTKPAPVEEEEEEVSESGEISTHYEEEDLTSGEEAKSQNLQERTHDPTGDLNPLTGQPIIDPMDNIKGFNSGTLPKHRNLFRINPRTNQRIGRFMQGVGGKKKGDIRDNLLIMSRKPLVHSRDSTPLSSLKDTGKEDMDVELE